jgi:hypothetical protein
MIDAMELVGIVFSELSALVIEDVEDAGEAFRDLDVDSGPAGQRRAGSSAASWYHASSELSRVAGRACRS